jgi:hypothetical protein
MTDEEFDRQYDAAVDRGKEHRAQLLIERTNRLKFFVETFAGRSNHLIHVAAYLVLEAHQSRRRAIWRYFCYAVIERIRSWRFSWEYMRRFWWYRLNGYQKQAAIEKTCDSLEARFLSEDKEK